MRSGRTMLWLAIFLMLAGGTWAQNSMTLDHVDGLSNTTSVNVNQVITFHIRMVHNSGGYITGNTNGFQIYSPTGAEWSTSSGAFTDAITTSMYDAPLQLNSFSITGSGADTLGFGGFRMFAPGIPSGFDAIVWTIDIGPISEQYHGGMICLDSAYYRPAGVWKWATTIGDILPAWDGPHCFTIYDSMITSDPEIVEVVPNYADQGETLDVMVVGQNTHFISGSTTMVRLLQGSSTIIGNVNSYHNDSLMFVRFSIPSNAPTGFWDFYTWNYTDGPLWLYSGFRIDPYSAQPEIVDVFPDHAYRGEALDVYITGENTHFISGSTTTVRFIQGSSTITPNSYYPYHDTLIMASFIIPINAPLGPYNVYTYNYMDGGLTLPGGFSVQEPIGMPDIAVTPPVLEQSLNSGEVVTRVLSIANHGSTVLHFDLSVNFISVDCTAVLNNPDPGISLENKWPVFMAYDEISKPEGKTSEAVKVNLNDDLKSIRKPEEFSLSGPLGWLYTDVTSGSVGPMDTLFVPLTFDAVGLYAGDYYAGVSIESNDPDEPLIIVPAHLHVSGTHVDAAITLDHVDGAAGEGMVVAGQQIKFHMRLTNNTGYSILGSTNGFRIYSPSGIHWDTTAGYFTNAITTEMYDGGRFVTPAGLTGSGADTLGFGGIRLLGPGIPSGFDEVVWTILIGPIHPSYAGGTICLDSSFYPPVNVWKWATSGGAIDPLWDGPHCFTVIEPWDDTCQLTFFNDFEETGMFYPYAIQTLPDCGLDFGDELGLFDMQQGILVGGMAYCGQELPLVVNAWKSDPDHGLQGYISGHDLELQIYKKHDDSVLCTDILGSDLRFDAASYGVIDSIFCQPCMVDLCMVIPGNRWRTISLPVNPIYDNVMNDITCSAPSIFGSLPGLDIVENDHGGVYIPSIPVNNLGCINYGEGYDLFRFGQDAQFCVRGGFVDPGPIPVMGHRWNMLGYPLLCEMPIHIALSSIAGYIDIVKDDEGGVYIPHIGVNTLGNMIPGKGYKIFLNCEANQMVQYPRCIMPTSEVITLNPITKSIEPQLSHYRFTETGIPFTIVLEEIGYGLQVGDEIAIYDGSLCVGGAVYNGEDRLVISAWQQDEQHSLPGYITNHPMDIKAYRSTGYEFSLLEHADNSYHFDEAPYLAINVAKSTSLPREFSLSQNFPNPFNPNTVMQFSVPTVSHVKLEIFNILGRHVKTLVDGDIQPGIHEVSWDGTNSSGGDVSSGIYFYRITASEFTETKKMLLMK